MSNADGFRFSSPGSPGHILDPHSGLAQCLQQSVGVLAPEAVTADALATAFSMMISARIEETLALLPGTEGSVV